MKTIKLFAALLLLSISVQAQLISSTPLFYNQQTKALTVDSLVSTEMVKALIIYADTSERSNVVMFTKGYKLRKKYYTGFGPVPCPDAKAFGIGVSCAVYHQGPQYRVEDSEFYDEFKKPLTGVYIWKSEEY